LCAKPVRTIYAITIGFSGECSLQNKNTNLDEKGLVDTRDKSRDPHIREDLLSPRG
jgi:hypothetical protein